MRFFITTTIVCFVIGVGVGVAPSVAHSTSQSVIISEVAWMGTETSYADEWIELHNTTNQTISFEGWGIYEQGGETLIEPLSGAIDPLSYYLIERTDDTTVPHIQADQKPTPWSGHGLNDNGEHLVLLNDSGTVIDEVYASDDWPAGDKSTDQTMEWTGSAWATSADPGGTPKAQNSTMTMTNDSDATVGAGDDTATDNNGTEQENNSEENEPSPPDEETGPEPDSEPEQEQEPSPDTAPTSKSTKQHNTSDNQVSYSSGVVINELMPSPDGPDAEREWVELYNTTDTPIDLGGWRLRDTVGSTNAYTVPENTLLAAGGFLVLSRPTTGITLNNDTDGVELLHPDDTATDTLNYNNAVGQQSYGRTDTAASWTTTPTPGSANVVTAPQQPKQGDPSKEQSPQNNTDSSPLHASSASSARVAQTTVTLPKHTSSPWKRGVAGILAVVGIAAGAAFIAHKKRHIVDNQE